MSGQSHCKTGKTAMNKAGYTTTDCPLAITQVVTCRVMTCRRQGLCWNRLKKNIWKGAMTLKSPVIAKEAKCYQWTDRPTDGAKDRHSKSCSSACVTNKAGYTATPVACGWAGAVIEVTRSFGQEQ